MAYTVLLFVHSWLRWVVVALVVVALSRAVAGARREAPWLDADSRVRIATVSAFDAQVLLGLVLYALSPMTPKAGAAMGTFMKDPALRFFTVEHVFAMLLALAAVHVGSVKSKKADNDRDRHKTWAIAVGVALFFVLAGMPWPFMKVARPLFRLP